MVTMVIFFKNTVTTNDYNFRQVLKFIWKYGTHVANVFPIETVASKLTLKNQNVYFWVWNGHISQRKVVDQILWNLVCVWVNETFAVWQVRRDKSISFLGMDPDLV